MFPFLGILQHYAKFDTRTTTMLEKLFGERSFGGFIDCLARCQGIIFVSLSGLDLPFVIQIVAPIFLGCWTLIALAIVTCL